jgi:hypothetical protein
MPLNENDLSFLIDLENIDVPRKIGVLDGKATFKKRGTGKITEEEFLGL